MPASNAGTVFRSRYSLSIPFFDCGNKRVTQALTSDSESIQTRFNQSSWGGDMSVVSRITLFLLASFLVAFNAGAWDRGKVERFATLPAGAPNPEGVAVDPRNGDVYVTGFNPT